MQGKRSSGIDFSMPDHLGFSDDGIYMNWLGIFVMAFKPYSIIFCIIFVSQSLLMASSACTGERASTYQMGRSIGRASIVDGDEIISASASQRTPAVTRVEQVNQSLRAQLDAVEVVTLNSVISLSPLHPKKLSFDEMAPPGRVAAAEAPVTANQVKRSYLCAGLDLDWSKGDIGKAAFVARGENAFWDGSTTGTAAAPSSYNALRYWLIKGPHKDGDRFNYSVNPNHVLLQFGADNKFRLENVFRIGNLTTTSIKSPFAKIFEGTESPIKDKYTIVNLSGLGSGAGSTADDWSCLTGAGTLLDVSFEASGTKYVLKNRGISLKNNTRALAMPLHHKDIDPDFGAGVNLVDDASWTTANMGPATWQMDLGYDVITSVGGSIEQGGLIKSTPFQHFDVWLWGHGNRAYIKPGISQDGVPNPNLCIDSHNGRYRSWLPVPNGWSRVTDHGGKFEWPGDGSKGTGRVDVGPYKNTMFPAGCRGYDSGISLWNGKPLFRFRANRIKGGARWSDDCDYGVFVAVPMGGLNWPTEIPWTMPKVKGMPDGMFDTTSGLQSVSEVSARTGDVAISPADHACHGITKWKFSEVYPYPIIARNAGRGVPEAQALLAKFFGQVIPPMRTPPANITSLHSDNISFGAMAKLQHKESGQYLTVSNYNFPADSTAAAGFYVTCTPDKASAGWWMVAPGKDTAARAGGVALAPGDSVSLVDWSTKKTMAAVDVLPPLSINYAAATDSEITPAILGRYNTAVGAFSGALPATTAVGHPSNWKVSPPSGTSGDIAKTSGVIFINTAMSGLLSSVNGYRFQPSSGSDWIQEVTVFDSGRSTYLADVGDFGTWMLADYVPAPSMSQDMVAAGFTGPLTSFDGTVFTLVQASMGLDGSIYGVDGSQNAVKIDPIKKTQEPIATGVRHVSVGTDGALMMLKTDGTIILRPSGGSDTVVPGCLGRSIAIGSATTFAACSVDGPNGLGHLMLNEANQLLSRGAHGSGIDITDDGYVFAVKPSANSGKSALSLWRKGSTAPWVDVSLDGLDQEIGRVSAGSTRFVAMRGHHGGLFVLDSTIGSNIFSNPDVLLTDPAKLAASSWNRVTVDGTSAGKQIIVADADISSNGDLIVLAGQVNDKFEFQLYTKSFAPWPKESEVFTLKAETSPAVAPVPPATTGGRAAVYSASLVSDNQRGFLKLSSAAKGSTIDTSSAGTIARFCMPSLNGYVTLQTKSGQTMQNSNSAIGLSKGATLQNLNLKTGKNDDGTILAAGAALDQTLITGQLAVGFGGTKFKSPKDADSVLERFMYYSLAPDASGMPRFKLQSKASGGYLKLSEAGQVVSLAGSETAQPIAEADGTIFVLDSVSTTELRLQQGLVGKNAREAMTVIESAFIEENSYAEGVEPFLENVLHWLDGVRISPDAWADFSQTKGDWVDPVTKLKASVTASERLSALVGDTSILSNYTLAPIFGDSSSPQKMRELDSTKRSDKLLLAIREEADATNPPSNLGLLKNVKDGSVVALRSSFGVDSDGCLTTEKDKIVSELFVSVDSQRKVVLLTRTTAIDPSVQFHMKVVPSPLASEANVDAGHNSADVQRWMMQSGPATDATVSRIYAPTLAAGTVDSRQTALEKLVLKFDVLPDTQASTLLPAYFDVDTVPLRDSSGKELKKMGTQVVIQSSSDNGYWSVGMPAVASASTVFKAGLQVIDAKTNNLKDQLSLDLDIRTQDVTQSGDGSFVQEPIVGAHNSTGFGTALFEIVVITPVIAALTAAFKQATFDAQAASFLAVSQQLEKMSDAVTFCQAITSFIKQSFRNSQDHWNTFVGNRAAREKLTQCLASLDQLFAEDLALPTSNLKSFKENLVKTLDIARVPSFGVSKSRADIIIDLQAQVTQLGQAGQIDKFVTTGSNVTFLSSLQRGVNDWFTSASISASDPKVGVDGDSLKEIITNYKNALGTSLTESDREALDGLSMTLTNSTTASNPIDVLQGIVTANTISNVVTFGSDAKYSFLSKLWELYKSSTLELDPEVYPPVAPKAGAAPVSSVVSADGKTIISRGDIFGLSPAQIKQLSSVLISVSRAPSGPSAPGGPFFGDDAKGDVRSAVGNDGWGWVDQPFGSLTNSQIMNQLAALFVPPTFAAFVAAYLQYLSASQDKLTELATSPDSKDQATVQRFVLRLVTLAEQWNTWQKGATPRLQRQELNQFKSLIRSVKSFVRTNPDLKKRTDRLMSVIQSAIDQLV